MTVTPPVRNAHCSFCGSAFEAELAWPRECLSCGQVSYVNPVPVAVVLLPVDDGLLVVRRAIPPQVGRLALPGGFVDLAESWQEAAARELFEEAGVRTDPAAITLFDASSAPGVLLVFGLAAPAPASALPPSVATEETSGWEIVREPVELAFPLHTAAAARYFTAR